MSESRIAQMFARRRARGEKALIVYLTAGDPSLERTPQLVWALERGGADLVELGMPFSDPIADGPVIQRASERALRGGATVAGVLQAAREIRRRSEIPLLLFSYLNPLLRYGFARLAEDLKAAGGDGCLLTDLSVEEASHHVEVLRAAGLDTVFLAAPTSPPERLARVAASSSGFVYLISRTGVTGERQTLAAGVEKLARDLRACTSLPLAVGFGISRPEHAAQAARFADGVVVGSAIVRLIEEHAGDADLETRLEQFARTMKQAMAPVAP